MKTIKPYTKKQLTKALTSVPEWSLNKTSTQLTRTFSFKNFVAALAFCAKIAVHAEVLDHHPLLELSYGQVKVKLHTHEVKGITKLDIELAKRIDNLTLS